MVVIGNSIEIKYNHLVYTKMSSNDIVHQIMCSRFSVNIFKYFSVETLCVHSITVV